jgi:hypothetical protein
MLLLRGEATSKHYHPLRLRLRRPFTCLAVGTGAGERGPLLCASVVLCYRQ